MALLALGDALHIAGTRYVVRGCAQLRSGVGDTWQEWLLVPTAGRADNAMSSLWFTEDDGELSLWKPITPPLSSPTPVFEPGERFDYDGRRYEAIDGGEYRVEALFGDLGGQRADGEHGVFRLLVSGDHLLELEWGRDGISASTGRLISRNELVAWSASTDRAVANRVAASSGRQQTQRALRHAMAPTVRQRMLRGAGIFGVFGLVAGLLMLPSCDNDCHERYNAATGQYEQHCDDVDGIRRLKGRRHGGWGGK